MTAQSATLPPMKSTVAVKTVVAVFFRDSRSRMSIRANLGKLPRLPKSTASQSLKMKHLHMRRSPSLQNPSGHTVFIGVQDGGHTRELQFIWLRKPFKVVI